MDYVAHMREYYALVLDVNTLMYTVGQKISHPQDSHSMLWYDSVGLLKSGLIYYSNYVSFLQWYVQVVKASCSCHLDHVYTNLSLSV